MALQTSGAISLNDVQNEFGGSNPIGINEYYGAAAGIPTSGQIQLDDFYGAADVPTLTYRGGQTGNSGTYNIGTPAADRLVVVVCGNNRKGSGLSSVTVNGVGLTVRNGGGSPGWEQAGLAYGFVSSGTSVNVTVQWSSFNAHGFAVYTVEGASQGYVNWWTGTSINTNISTNVGDCIIGVAVSSSSRPNWTIENVSDPYDYSFSYGYLGFSANSYQATDSSTHVQVGGYEIAIVQVR